MKKNPLVTTTLSLMEMDYQAGFISINFKLGTISTVKKMILIK